LDASGTSELVIDNLSVTWLTAAASTQPLGVINMNRVIYICFGTCLLAGCAKQTQRLPVKANTSPSPTVAVSAAEAKVAFDSPDALTKALERRWPLNAIRIYCIPERRHNNAYQNLVAYSPVWNGLLYSGVATGFDKIAWYASTNKGRADQYSLGVNRGTDFWLLEIGDESTLQAPPKYSPDPNSPQFVGHK